MTREAGSSPITPLEAEQLGRQQSPEEHPTAPACVLKDAMLDESLAETFPGSDPPSTTLDPTPDDCEQERKLRQYELLAGLAPGSWAAISIDEQRVVGTGQTQEEAEQKAREAGHLKLWLVQVAEPPLQAPEAA